MCCLRYQIVGIPFTCLWAGTYGKAVTCLWKQPGGCLRKTPPSLLVVKKIKKNKNHGFTLLRVSCAGMDNHVKSKFDNSEICSN